MTPLPESSGPRATPSKAAARQLLERELGDGQRGHQPSDREAVALAEQALERVHASLARSFGAYGSVALIMRAVVRTRTSNPVLRRVRVVVRSAAHGPGSDDHALHVDGLSPIAPEHAGAVMPGLTNLLATLTDLLGELIGDELARTLLGESISTHGDGGGAPDAPSMADEPRPTT